MAEQRYALVIGNSMYDDVYLSQLKTPDADVTALASLLESECVGGFDEVIRILNEPASIVRKAIARFVSERTREDLLLLFFSGHGVLDEQGHLYLATRDTERNLLKGTAIEASFITEVMDSSHSRRQVLILDCCHSGAFERGMKGVVRTSVGTAAAFKGVGSGRIVLTATDSTQYAWEGDQIIGDTDNSVFTHYLIEGLSTGKADTDADGRITVDELYDYVYDHVVQKTPRQVPGKWAFKQHGEIVIASNPHAIPRRPALPYDLQVAMESLLSSVREGAIHDLAVLLRGCDDGLKQAAKEALQHLTTDDSRRVATAALEILRGYDEASAMQQTRIREAAQAAATPDIADPTAAARLPQGAHTRAEAQAGTPAPAVVQRKEAVTQAAGKAQISTILSPRRSKMAGILRLMEVHRTMIIVASILCITIIVILVVAFVQYKLAQINTIEDMISKLQYNSISIYNGPEGLTARPQDMEPSYDFNRRKIHTLYWEMVIAYHGDIRESIECVFRIYLFPPTIDGTPGEMRVDTSVTLTPASSSAIVFGSFGAVKWNASHTGLYTVVARIYDPVLGREYELDRKSFSVTR